MSDFTAVYDACVLYPAPLRDLLMYLALADLFRAKWTDAIHNEWIRSVLKERPDLKPEQLERTRDLMNAHVRDCLVTNYEDLIPALTLPDPDDRHVLAAAIRAGADVIVTFNLDDFPADALGKYGIEGQHPDDFIMHLLDLAPNVVCAAAKRQRQSLKKPPKTVSEFLEALERQGLPQTVAALRLFSELI
ncbi:MAG: PIN domain-containing protein [Acidobacteria bacterium]|nr:PIN domain-containing protein [Acidobacteriota bacterium]MCI0724774.1 PIN domain-containing protein [Acidobacteriota bacterium]